MEKFDLHTHSNMSDGSLTPTEVVKAAHEAGIALLALTDHDCTLGVEEAMEAGRRLAMGIVPGMELDTEYHEELHMLGLGIDVAYPPLKEFMRENARRRQDRNESILRKLEQAGINIQPYMPLTKGNLTRLHIALALMAGGYAQNIPEAFQRYLLRGMPGFVESRRIQPEAAIDLIHRAGGLAVLAHPCKIKGNIPSLIDRLAKAGLDGLEAFYPTATAGQRAAHISLARQYGLLLSAGSDFHGANRANVLGSAWEDTDLLAPIYQRLVEKAY